MKKIYLIGTILGLTIITMFTSLSVFAFPTSNDKFQQSNNLYIMQMWDTENGVYEEMYQPTILDIGMNYDFFDMFDIFFSITFSQTIEAEIDFGNDNSSNVFILTDITREFFTMKGLFTIGFVNPGNSQYVSSNFFGTTVFMFKENTPDMTLIIYDFYGNKLEANFDFVFNWEEPFVNLEQFYLSYMHFEDFEDEYRHGYDKGYQDGLSKTNIDEIYNQGYRNGYDDAYDVYFPQGYRQGYDQGLNDGYIRGRSDGETIGYNEARAFFGLFDNNQWYTAQTWGQIQFSKGQTSETNYFDIMFTGFFGFITALGGIQLLPGLYIWHFVVFPLVFGIIFFIIGRSGGDSNKGGKK